MFLIIQQRKEPRKLLIWANLFSLIGLLSLFLALCYRYQIISRFCTIFTSNREWDRRLESRLSYGHKNKIREFYFFFMKIYYRMILKTAEVELWLRQDHLAINNIFEINLAILELPMSRPVNGLYKVAHMNSHLHVRLILFVTQALFYFYVWFETRISDHMPIYYSEYLE